MRSDPNCCHLFLLPAQQSSALRPAPAAGSPVLFHQSVYLPDSRPRSPLFPSDGRHHPPAPPPGPAGISPSRFLQGLSDRPHITTAGCPATVPQTAANAVCRTETISLPIVHGHFRYRNTRSIEQNLHSLHLPPSDTVLPAMPAGYPMSSGSASPRPLPAGWARAPAGAHVPGPTNGKRNPSYRSLPVPTASSAAAKKARRGSPLMPAADAP